MLTLLFALSTQAPPPPPPAPPDTTLFPPRETVMRLYTDCDEDRWPWGVEEAFVPKPHEEIVAGVARRRALEADWRRWYAEHGGDSLPATPADRWVFPLAVRGRLLDNFASPRERSRHEALDIFAREGTVVRSPINGLVVAAGDGWRGGYTRRRGFFYDGDGLSRRAGNGLILFDPAGGAYMLFSHLRAGLPVRAGDVVRAGQALGRVGHSGNAAYPGRGGHLHFAYKEPGSECGVDGVLVAVNPYRHVRAARQRMR
jgi:murein DD-endopeptidase MepM/ murein hydrolase activator NlpD